MSKNQQLLFTSSLCWFTCTCDLLKNIQIPIMIKKHPNQQNFSQKDANVHNIFINTGFKDLISYFTQ
jgi:hypothetical protein